MHSSLMANFCSGGTKYPAGSSIFMNTELSIVLAESFRQVRGRSASPSQEKQSQTPFSGSLKLHKRKIPVGVSRAHRGRRRWYVTLHEINGVTPGPVQFPEVTGSHISSPLPISLDPSSQGCVGWFPKSAPGMVRCTAALPRNLESLLLRSPDPKVNNGVGGKILMLW